MTVKAKIDHNIKILVLLVLVSSILAISVLAMGYYQENKFERTTINSYIKRYESLFFQFINNSLDKLHSDVVNDSNILNNINITIRKTDYLLIFKNNKFEYGIYNKNKKLHTNILNFIPNSNISGIIKLQNKLYLYSSYGKSKRQFIVLLRPFSSFPILQHFGTITSNPVLISCRITQKGNIYVGLCNKNKKGYILLTDIFKKPIATVIIQPKISNIFSAHYRTIFQILLFTVIAIVVSALLSYIIIKKAVLDSIDNIIKSIKNIHHDLVYIKPKLKDKQFQLLVNTLEWLTLKIKESEYLFNKIADLIPMGIIVYKHTPIYANKYAIRFFGQNIVGVPLADLVNEKYKRTMMYIKNKRIDGKNFYATYTAEIDKPKNRVIRISSTTINYKGEPAGLMAFMDITNSERAKKLYKIVSKVGDIIIKAAEENDMLKEVCLMLTSYDIIDATWVSKNNIDNVILNYGEFNEAKEKLESSTIEIDDESYIKNTDEYSIMMLPINIDGRNEYFVGLYSKVGNLFDRNTKSIISQIKINLELAIEHLRTQQEKTLMLFYDSLTGLKNFNSLKKDIAEVSSCVLIYINIRSFSVISQVYGYEFSDKILQHIGILLRNNVKGVDNVYRLHGDKFAILIKNEIDKENIEKLIARLQNRLAALELNSRKISIHTDIGVTMFPSLTKTPQKLIESAEVALTKSKETKRVCFYSSDMQKDIEENFTLEAYIRTAIEKRLFFFYYQPILNLKSKKIEKAEALIRLKDKNGNFINPEKFISIAEKVNIISDLTKIVIEKVLQEVSNLEGINISINLSSKDIENPNIVSLLEENITKNKLNPTTISIELTERDVMHNFQSTKLFIEKLRKSNIEIEIDDFGIGYSSFDRIVDLDFDILKIDKSLIDLIGTNQKAEQVIVYIIKLAHSLHSKALAEGIETKEQFDFLSENDCDYIQGYYISKPLSFNKFLKFLEKKF